MRIEGSKGRDENFGADDVCRFVDVFSKGKIKHVRSHSADF